MNLRERSNSASLLIRTLRPVQDRSRDSHGVPRDRHFKYARWVPQSRIVTYR
jgi:hypothetical protein